jgi:hypothetical protein
MIFRPDRDRRGVDRDLDVKMLIFVVGAALGIAGMARGIDWLVYAAIVVLGLGALLRLLSRRTG